MRITLALMLLAGLLVAVFAGHAAAPRVTPVPIAVLLPVVDSAPRTLELDLPVSPHTGTDAGLITTPAGAE